MTQMDKIKTGRCIKNNGRVLRTINLLSYRYVRLTDAQYALDDIPEDELLDSINYLTEAGYIKSRDIKSHSFGTLADYNIEQLEAKLTDKGLKLLSGKLKDEMVDV
ncbi:MAG: type VI secretion protein [Acutalibacteraceae bacterium]|nr:type VI secretion protein [Acutalibacteraceae bacterium]